ncbi:MAG: hypothetical protein AAGL96_04610 [Pseudomonadota bacterium]
MSYPILKLWIVRAVLGRWTCNTGLESLFDENRKTRRRVALYGTYFLEREDRGIGSVVRKTLAALQLQRLAEAPLPNLFLVQASVYPAIRGQSNPLICPATLCKLAPTTYPNRYLQTLF